MMWYWGGGVHWWGWLLGTIAMIAFWALIIWAIWYWIVTASRRPPDHQQRDDDAKRILDERLARGEIDTDEYRRLLAVIRGESIGAGNEHSPVGTAGPR
jgi:putative membrane protein